jgi:hypothetical protein
MRKYEGKVVIASFFYKQQAYLDYTHSLTATVLVLERLGIKFDYWPISGNFHMELCVNETLSKFLRDEDATDIVLIDSDEGWNPESLVRLLMHEEDIVCGVYKLTNPAEVKYPVILKTAEDGHHLGRMLEDGNCLLEALKIPGGFVKISKEALRKWVEKFPDNWLHPESQKIYTFFLNEVRDHTFHGMDFCFAERMREAGVRIWVDPMCDVIHWGPVPFKGTLDSHLRAMKVAQEGKDAFAVIAQMAKEIEERNGQRCA